MFAQAGSSSPQRLAKSEARGRRFFPACSLPRLLAAIAALYFAAGVALLWLPQLIEDSSPLRTAAGVIVVLLALAIWQVARVVTQHRERVAAPRWFTPLLSVRWIFCGVFFAYVAALVIGPIDGAQYLFAAALAVWTFLPLVVLSAAPQSQERWRQRLTTRGVRLASGVVHFIVLSLVCTELALHGFAMLGGSPFFGASLAGLQTLPPASDFHGRAVNSLGYWDDEFQSVGRPGTFRVAALGDSVTLSGTAQTNYLAQLERLVPGVEVYNFGVPGAGPRDYAVRLTTEVLDYGPDLVLVFFSVEDDLAPAAEGPGLFEWQSLRLVQAGFSRLPLSTPSTSSIPDSKREPSLAVCRTPIDEMLHRRWRAVLSQLAKVAEQCREREVAVALVLVPAEFQVRSTLRETLCRRQGLCEKQIDLELPQRRLESFAHEHSLPLLDLLPYLRHADSCLYARNEPHWNDQGQELVAQTLGHWLQSRFGGPIASATAAR